MMLSAALYGNGRYAANLLSAEWAPMQDSPREQGRSKALGWSGFALATALSCCFLFSPGTSDVVVWKSWSDVVQERGYLAAYNDPAVYINQPPLGILMLGGVGGLSRAAGIPAYVWPERALSGFKVSVLVFLLLASGAVGFATKNAALAAVAQLGLLLNSVVLGYFDVYFVPALVLSLWALKRRNLALATALLFVTCMVKWQPLLIAPFALLYMLDAEGVAGLRSVSWRRVGRGVVLPGGLCLLMAGALAGPGMAHAFARGQELNMLSGNALNFNWIVTYCLHVFYPEGYGPLAEGVCEVVRTRDVRIVGLAKALFWGSYLMALACFFQREKSFENLLRYALVGYLSYCMFNTGVHENHFYPAMVLGFFLFLERRAFLPLAIALAVGVNLNMFVFYGLNGKVSPFPRVVGVDITLPLAMLYLAAFAGLYGVVLLGDARKARRT